MQIKYFYVKINLNMIFQIKLKHITKYKREYQFS